MWARALAGRSVGPLVSHLRQAGDARTHGVAVMIFRNQLFIEHAAGTHADCMATRPDNRHVTLQHIEELRELVNSSNGARKR